MRRFLIRRAISSFAVVVGVVLVIFVLSRMIGDPVTLMIQPGMTEADVENLRRYWGLDKPIIEQFVVFVGSALSGHFGLSIWQGQPALDLVLEALPATLLLTVSAMALAIVGALVLGSIGALFPNSPVDRAISAACLVGQSVPHFWLGLLLILAFATNLRLLPTGGYGTFSHLVLPTLTLCLFPLTRLTRLVRSGLAEAMAQDYVRTARSKGLSTSEILVRHCLRNIAISLVTVVAVDFAYLIGGAIVTETIFAWPGVGRLMIQAISHRDFPVLQAAAFVIAASVVVSSLLADIAYALINPRVRYD